MAPCRPTTQVDKEVIDEQDKEARDKWTVGRSDDSPSSAGHTRNDDDEVAVRDAVGGAAPWGAVTAYFNADSDKAEYMEQLRAHHREGHDRGGNGGRRRPCRRCGGRYRPPDTSGLRIVMKSPHRRDMHFAERLPYCQRTDESATDGSERIEFSDHPIEAFLALLRRHRIGIESVHHARPAVQQGQQYVT